MKLEIVDDYTFKCSFTQPYGGFPVNLAIGGWHAYDVLLQPRHYLEQFHKKYADPAKLDALIKEGKFETWVQLFNNKWGSAWDYMRARTIDLPKLSPWILKEANDQRTVLERNPYYFKVDAAGNQMPYIDRIEFTTVADPEVLAVKQFAGETDYGCEVVTMPKIALYKQNEAKGNYNLKFGNIHRTAGVIFLNLTYKDDNWRKVVQDIRFRQALNMAINRKEIIDAVYYGYAEPTDLVPNKYDEAGAMKLLDAMGMDKKDADGFRLGPDGKTFTILIEPHNDFWDHGPVAQLCRAVLEQDRHQDDRQAADRRPVGPQGQRQRVAGHGPLRCLDPVVLPGLWARPLGLALEPVEYQRRQAGRGTAAGGQGPVHQDRAHHGCGAVRRPRGRQRMREDDLRQRVVLPDQHQPQAAAHREQEARQSHLQ